MAPINNEPLKQLTNLLVDGLHRTDRPIPPAAVESAITTAREVGALPEADKAAHQQSLKSLRKAVNAYLTMRIDAEAGVRAKLVELQRTLPEGTLVGDLTDDATEIWNETQANVVGAGNVLAGDAQEVWNRATGGDIQGAGNYLAEKTLSRVGSATEQVRSWWNSDNIIARWGTRALVGLGAYWLSQQVLAMKKDTWFGMILRGLGITALAGAIVHGVGAMREAKAPAEAAEEAPPELAEVNWNVPSLSLPNLLQLRKAKMLIGAARTPVEMQEAIVGGQTEVYINIAGKSYRMFTSEGAAPFGDTSQLAGTILKSLLTSRQVVPAVKDGDKITITSMLASVSFSALALEEIVKKAVDKQGMGGGDVEGLSLAYKLKLPMLAETSHTRRITLKQMP